MAKTSRTFKDLIESGADLVRMGAAINDWESIYKCPFCEEIKGTPDKRGHLYWNLKKRKGKCFRCDTKVVYGQKLTLEEICQDYVRFNKEATEGVLVAQTRWDVESWTVPSWTSYTARRYLEKRGVTQELQELFNLRFTDWPYEAIVLPNGRGADINFFQLRKIKIESEYELRYINPGATKPVYGTFLPPKPTALLIEGPFSVIGAYQPDILPLGLYGKSLSGYQMELIKAIPEIERYVVCLDGGEGYATMNMLNHLVTTDKEVGVIILPHKKDPSDLSANFRQWVNAAIPVNSLTLKLVSNKVKFNRQNSIAFDEDSWKKFGKLLADPSLNIEIR